MKKQIGYDKCKTCSCFFSNLEKVGVHIESECSHEFSPLTNENCFCFSKFKPKKKIILNYQGERLTFYKVHFSDERAMIMAVHSLEKMKKLKRGALVPYFKEGQEKNKVEIHTIKESD